jgi:Flp pilus assembly protein TadG
MRWSPGDDRGMVTAELAVGLPALILVLGIALFAQAAVAAQLRCVDAASVAARLLARGEPASVADATAMSAAPAGAQLTTGSGSTDGVPTVHAVVRATVWPMLAWLPGVPVSATTVVAAEPQLPGAPAATP